MLQQVVMSNGLSVNFASNVKQLYISQPGHSISFLNRIWFWVLQHDQFFQCLTHLNCFSNVTQFAFEFWIACGTYNISELKWTSKNMKVRWIFHSLHSGRLFLLGIHSIQSWTATTRYGVTKKRGTKRLEDTGNLFRKNLQLKDVC